MSCYLILIPKRFSGWSSEDIYNYSWKGVPQLLNHLNQQREHLRHDFPARLVFLMPPFVVDYFIQRAADFLDWRSGLFRFPRDPEEITQDAERFATAGGYDKYLKLTPEQRIERILELKSLQEVCSDTDSKANILVELGLLFNTEHDYGNAIASYEKALEIKPDCYRAWNNRGVALSTLGRKEEAITSYDKALAIKPDFHEAWFNQGATLSDLGRKQEAITSYDQALAIKPDKHAAWNNRGIALSDLGRKEEAITSYDQAIAIKPNYHEAWNNRGIALAHKSVVQAILLKPNDARARYNKAYSYALQEQIDLAIDTLQQAITLDSKYRELAKTDTNFDGIRSDPRFQALIGASIPQSGEVES